MNLTLTTEIDNFEDPSSLFFFRFHNPLWDDEMSAKQGVTSPGQFTLVITHSLLRAFKGTFLSYLRIIHLFLLALCNYGLVTSV